jgi:hypothetical protein
MAARESHARALEPLFEDELMGCLSGRLFEPSREVGGAEPGNGGQLGNFQRLTQTAGDEIADSTELSQRPSLLQRSKFELAETFRLHLECACIKPSARSRRHDR